jgi:tRNA U34 2-thiouridine synthase MnmA/TrmU
VALADLSFVDTPPSPADDIDAQARAHGEPVSARLLGSTLCFARPQPRVAPGQVVALYRGDTLLGGGIAI